MLNSKKINVGISIGDPNGIGIEVILKALSECNLHAECNFIIYSSYDLIDIQKKHLKIKTLPLNRIKDFNNLSNSRINIKEIFTNSNFKYGEHDKEVSANGILSFKHAVKDASQNKIDVLVTSPINKELSYSSSFKFSGHTDYLKNFFDTDPLMLMVSEKFRIGLLTEHIPLKKIVNEISAEKITQKIKTLKTTLNNDFLINDPKVAVLSINPHVGDNGVIGDDDQNLLIPIISKLNNAKHLIFGPFSADTFFSNDNYKKYDVILAAYHDQGLIPFKTLTFGRGVNYSAGLPIIRTSPDHGTGFDIAGKGIANSSSFLNAIKLGLDIFRSRNLIV